MVDPSGTSSSSDDGDAPRSVTITLPSWLPDPTSHHALASTRRAAAITASLLLVAAVVFSLRKRKEEARLEELRSVWAFYTSAAVTTVLGCSLLAAVALALSSALGMRRKKSSLAAVTAASATALKHAAENAAAVGVGDGKGISAETKLFYMVMGFMATFVMACKTLGAS